MYTTSGQQIDYTLMDKVEKEGRKENKSEPNKNTYLKQV